MTLDTDSLSVGYVLTNTQSLLWLVMDLVFPASNISYQPQQHPIANLKRNFSV
ncbi:hypothetical protein [Chroococcidiopsis cubana]|uniref:hypothetical protein n=1 Tax=Chroococcidiopsis cubana TaxID=171392 RepID=UPI001315686B|nr:hypothetical protein [Chroococcidiopsis cubana]